MICNQQVVGALCVFTLLTISALQVFAQETQPKQVLLTLTPSQVQQNGKTTSTPAPVEVDPPKPTAAQASGASRSTTKAPDSKLVESTPTQVGDNRELVTVQNHDNQSKVDVHVPLIFDMTNDKDLGSGHSKLDLSVLSGLVTVNRDKKRQPDGTVSGPVTVTVFGIPVYQGKAVRASEGIGERIMQELQSGRRQSADTLTTNTSEVYAAVRKANENAMKPIAEMLRKMSTLISQQSTAATNVNGRPTEAKDKFVVASKFSRADFEPKTPKILLKKDDSAHESQAYS